VGFRILVVGRIAPDVRRELTQMEAGTEIVEADPRSDRPFALDSFEPHLLVLGEGAGHLDLSASADVPQIPVLAVGSDLSADLVLPGSAASREPVLRSARKLASMRRALLAASEAAAGEEAAAFRRFLELLDNEFLRAVRYRHPLSLVLTSIDDLGGLVRDYGRAPVHAFLEVLRSSLQRSVRQVDLVFHSNPEEIAVLLPETTASGALVVAERLRMQSRRLLFKPPATGDRPTLPIKITSSVGIVDAPREGLSSSAEFLAQGRAAVARARRAGGDHAVVHGELAVESMETGRHS
jgi:diguanylate cyclase (GGDEF)-like protein